MLVKFQIQIQSKSKHTVNSPLRAPPPIRAPLPLLTTSLLSFWTFLAISQPIMVRFSFCKNPLEAGNVYSLMGAPPKVLPPRPVPLLGNLRYFQQLMETSLYTLYKCIMRLTEYGTCTILCNSLLTSTVSKHEVLVSPPMFLAIQVYVPESSG